MPKKTLGISRDFDEAGANALKAAKQGLLAAAAAHKVSIKADQIAYSSHQKVTLVHAPIRGIERLKNSDFAAGAAILLIIIKSSRGNAIPNGSYLIKARHALGAKSGKAIFTDRTGTIVAQRDLIVRTWTQSGVLFPNVFPSPPPVEIPNITSTHIFIPNPPGPPKQYVDCTGWDPVRTLLFET